MSANLFLWIWDAAMGGLIAALAFHWGRVYERKQHRNAQPWLGPVEPVLGEPYVEEAKVVDRSR